MRLPAVLFYLVACSLSAPGQTSPSQSVIRDQAALSVLEEALAESGIANKAPTAALTLRGTFNAWRGNETQSGDVAINVRDRHTYTMESSSGGKKTAAVAAGRKLSKIDTTGKVEPLKGNALLNADFDFLPALVELQDYTAQANGVRYLGLVESENGSTHHVRITKTTPTKSSERASLLAPFMSSEIFIDTKTLLVSKRTKMLPRIGNAKESIQTEFYYSDYRSIDGVMVPFKISQFIEGQKILELTIESASTGAITEVVGGAQ